MGFMNLETSAIFFSFLVSEFWPLGSAPQILRCFFLVESWGEGTWSFVSTPLATLLRFVHPIWYIIHPFGLWSNDTHTLVIALTMTEIMTIIFVSRSAALTKILLLRYLLSTSISVRGRVTREFWLLPSLSLPKELWDLRWLIFAAELRHNASCQLKLRLWPWILKGSSFRGAATMATKPSEKNGGHGHRFTCERWRKPSEKEQCVGMVWAG